MANAGRPTKYLPEMDEQAYKLCLLGFTTEDLSQFFGVCHRTIDGWLVTIPSFAERVRAGKELADANVAAKLYHRATGYSHDAVKILTVGGAVEAVPYVEHYPPDTAAAIFWLKNRQRGRWKDRVETELSGPDGGPIQTVGIQTTDPVEAARTYQRMINGS